MIKCAFFDAKPYDREYFDRANVHESIEFVYFEPHLDKDTVRLTEGFDAICVFVNDSISAVVVEALAKNGIKLIVLRCAGYNNVDLKAVFGKIHVVRVPAYSPYAVAEYAVALILALNRKTHKAYNRTREMNFSISGLMGFDLSGKTAGIIGTGRIGKVLARILIGFGMKVFVYDVHPDPDFAKQTGCSYEALDTIYRESDIISLHCPLTKETLHMINATTISQMKNGVMIINTGRGKLINSPDLVDGLKSAKVGAAGLDVYEEESEYFFEDNSTEILTDDVLARLMTFPNVIITSHQAFFTSEALMAITQTSIDNILDFFNDKKLTNEICYQCCEARPCAKHITGRCF